MRPIPKALRNEISANPFMQQCCYPECNAMPEWEHAFIYRGRQINEVWAIIPVCYKHHRGDQLDKNYNQWVAINRATEKDFAKYPKKDWQQLKRYLNNNYGG